MHKAASKAVFDAQVAKLTERLLRSRQWSINGSAYPVLDVTFESSNCDPLRVRLICDDWNDQPASIEFLTAEGDHLHELPADTVGVFNGSAHPATGRPFACTSGSREYHTHPSHVTDRWDNYKKQAGFDLGGILTKIWKTWRRTTR